MRTPLLVAPVAFAMSLWALPASAEPTAPAGAIDVHVDGPAQADFERRAADGTWQHVCMLPCDAQANAGEQYRVLGTDVAPSAPFMIDGSKGKASIKVNAGSIRKSRTGLWLLGGAGVLGIASVVTLIVGGVFDGFDSSGVVSQGRTDALFAGSFMLLGALGLGAYGGATWYNNKASTVDGSVVLPGARPAEPVPAAKSAFMFPVLRLQF